MYFYNIKNGGFKMYLIKLLIFFHTITVDGNINDWTGKLPSNIHSYTFSNGEFIYRGGINDFRTDLGNTLYADLTEFRLTCDDSWVYFLIKFQEIDPNDKDSIHVEISIGNPGDGTSYLWIGDDAQLGLTKRALADRIIAFHSSQPGNFVIELWDGGSWYAPLSEYEVVVSDVNDCIEAKISKSDIADGGLSFPTAIRISLATFKNVVGWNNDTDATEDIGGGSINDAVDVLGGKEGVSENAWKRDLSDNVINKFFDICIRKHGDVSEFTRKVDGNPSDWTGTSPPEIHGVQYSNKEWIYKGDIGDMRTDPEVPDDLVYDLIELRLTADTVNLYIMAKFYHMDFQETQIAISLDKDSLTNDDKLIINGDDTDTYLAQPVQYSERELLLTADSVNHAEIFLFADDGFEWYTPPSPYKISIDPSNRTIEARIQLVDLNISADSRIRISGATYDANVQSIGNSPNGSDDPGTPIEEGDMSVDYNTCDALDVIGGNEGQKQSSWDRDLSDGDLDFYYTIKIDSIMNALGIEDEFFFLYVVDKGVIIRYNINSNDEVIILKRTYGSEYREIKRSYERRGEYYDRDVSPYNTYFYLLKSGNKTLGPLSVFIKDEGNLRIYGMNSFYAPFMKNFYIFNASGRRRVKSGKGLILLNDFKKGVYFIKDKDKVLKIVNVR